MCSNPVRTHEVEAFYNNIIAGLKAEADNSNRVLIEAIERLNRRLEI
ncbi:9182_t:CDS:2 [Entrophospora sp. SA101]|nr:9182_t:CDS:2 [Entrophospora sp. SA101]